MLESNTGYLLAKFSRNVVRDREVAQQLAAVGWRVFVA
jgi:G:T-mismatch repair DNA endonuclease (very short patch repair protein)